MTARLDETTMGRLERQQDVNRCPHLQPRAVLIDSELTNNWQTEAKEAVMTSLLVRLSPLRDSAMPTTRRPSERSRRHDLTEVPISSAPAPRDVVTDGVRLQCYGQFLPTWPGITGNGRATQRKLTVRFGERDRVREMELDGKDD